ncbi:hypothetical protein [Candidatus Poriferisodalis sp.]|uniref:hypothetical protein n=1 Tax=Candidatus Poriferisodalis sp. TaxID=3101277 RepID=UPI003B016D73
MSEHSTTRATGPYAQLRRTHRLASDQADAPDPADPAEATGEAGQTTAEYALLTGAIALLVAAVTAWATSTGKIGRLLDAVFNYLTKAIS